MNKFITLCEGSKHFMSHQMSHQSRGELKYSFILMT